jgi:hypothetical protein
MPKVKPLSEFNRNLSAVLSDEAYFSLSDIPSLKIRRHIVTVLEATPYLGHKYQPLYNAAPPAIPCRMFYCKFLGIYYYVSEQSKTVTVIAIEDRRQNSMNRFPSYMQI